MSGFDFRRHGIWAAALLGVAMVGLQAGTAAAQQPQPVEPPLVAKWYLSPSLGVLKFEGDEELEDGVLLSMRLGYEYSEWWSFEAGLSYAPKLDENFRNSYGEKISRLQEIPGNEGVTDVSAVGLFGDALFHFTRWERLDPYLALGAGLTQYSEDMGNGKTDPAIRAGGGVMYHINDEWALRADGRMFIAGKDTEANATINAGVVWTWGARVPRNYMAVGGSLDSDGDGLTDEHENRIGTKPSNPDTDGDALTDGQEVLQYDTNPLDPDTDYDGLTDGEEVLIYGTDPKKWDTDDGGVSDGHEVLEDGTNPRDGSDDLILFELYIQFDYDKAILKPEYFAQLETIAKVLRRHPNGTARIEGHADKLKKSVADHNQKLSERRAKAVLSHLSDAQGIDRSRLTALGYGFSRPKAPNDPILGNPLNRRVDVYIRKDGGDWPTITPPKRPLVVPLPARVPTPLDAVSEPAAK